MVAQRAIALTACPPGQIDAGRLLEVWRLDNGRAAYSLPLTGDGLRLELAAARTRYELGSEYADLDATGDAYSLEGLLTYPLLRSREQNLYLSLGVAKKCLRDEIGAIDLAISKKVQTGTLNLRHERWGALFGLNAYSGITAGLTYGHLDFNDDGQAALNKAGADTAGDFARLFCFLPVWSNHLDM